MKSPHQDPTQQKTCEHPLEFTPARSSASAGELGFLTQKKHNCPSILDQDANMLLPAIKHIIRTSPITVFSRLDSSSCFVQTVLTDGFIHYMFKKGSQVSDRP